MIDQIFWWTGAMVSAAGALALAAALYVGLGWLAYEVTVMVRIASLVKYHPLPSMDCAPYRWFFRFKWAVRFLFGGVPTEICARNYGVVFHQDWIKNGVPEGGD